MADNQPAAPPARERVVTSLASLSARHAELKKAFKAMFFDPITLEEYNIVLSLEDENNQSLITTNADYMRFSLKVRKFEVGRPFPQARFRRDFATLARAMGSILNTLGQFDSVDPESLGPTALSVQDGRPNPVYMRDVIDADIFRGVEIIKLEFATLFRMMAEVMQRTLQQVPDPNDEITHTDLEEVALATADLIEAILARPTPNFADPALGLSETVETLPGLNLTDVISGSFDYLTAPLVFGEGFYTTTKNLMFFVTGPNAQVLPAGESSATKDWLEFEKSFDLKKAALQSGNLLLPIAVNIEISKALGSMLGFYNNTFVISDVVGTPLNWFQAMRVNWSRLLPGALNQLGLYYQTRKQPLTPLLMPALIAATVRWSVGPFKVRNQFAVLYRSFDRALSRMAASYQETDDPLGWMVIAALTVIVEDWYRPRDGNPPVVSIKETPASREPLSDALQRFLKVKDTDMTSPVRINDNSHHLAIVDILNDFAFFRPDVGTLEEICRLLVTAVRGINFAALPDFNASAWLEVRDLQVVRVNPQGAIARGVLSRGPNTGADPLRPFAVRGLAVPVDPFSLYAEFAKGGRMVLRQGAVVNNTALVRARQQTLVRQRRLRLRQALRVLRQEQEDLRQAQLAVQTVQRQQQVLEDQVDDVQEEQAKTQEEIAALQNANREAMERIVELEDEASAQAAAAFEFAQRLAEAEESLSEVEAQRDLALSAVRQAEDDMNEIMFTLRQVEADRTEAARVIEQLQQEVVASEIEIENQEAERQTILDDLARARQDTRQLESVRDEVQQEVSTIDDARLKTALEQKNAFDLLDILEEAANAALVQEDPNEAARLRTEINKKTAELEILKEKLATQTALLVERQQALEEATETLDARVRDKEEIERTLQTTTLELEETRIELGTATSRIIDLERASDETAAIILETQQELEQTARDRDLFRDQAIAAETTIAELQDDVAQRGAQLEDITTQLSEQDQAQLASLTAELENANKARAEADKKIKNLERRNTKLLEDLTKLANDLVDAENTIQVLTRKKDKEDADVSDAEDDFEDALDEFEDAQNQLDSLPSDGGEGSSTRTPTLLAASLIDVRQRFDKTLVGINLLSNPYENGEVQFYFETLERLGSLVYSFNRRIVDNWVSRPVLSATERFDAALEDYFLNGNAPGLYKAIDALRTALDDQVNQNILDRLSVVDSLCGFITP